MVTQQLQTTITLLVKEVRTLREDIALMLPYESIEEYAHPKRISASFKRAIKKYPIRNQ